MTRHVSPEKLAMLQAGELRGVRARRVRAHLHGCATCQSVTAELDRVPALLAGTGLPPMPEHLAVRIDNALAAESARRAAGKPAIGQPATGQPVPRPAAVRSGAERSRHRSAGRSWLPVPALRLAAAAAAVVILGGGGYEVASNLGSSPSGGVASGSSASSLSAPAASPHGQAFSGAQGVPAYGPPVQYRQAGHTATVRPVRTSTDYQTARLAQQVRSTLAMVGGAAPGAIGIARPGTSNAIGSQQLSQLSGCLSRVAAGRRVLLVNQARFSGTPATVIVTAAGGGTPEQVWVVGPRCSAGMVDLLAHQDLPVG